MSALYKSGTVTVTNGSNIVTGSGTSFISIAGIVPGALFTINGVNWYEVYEVNTNTQIKVRTIPAGQTFQQATASGQDYAIFQNFTSLSPTEIAARVVAIQQKWHIREEEMTDWFASTNDFEEITNINGDKITVMTPFGVNNLLGSAATRDVGTADGNVLEAGTGGIGRVNGLPSGSSLQGEYENGFYYIPNATSRPTQNAASWYLTVENVNNNPTYRKYTATALGLVDDSPQPWTCLKINGVFTEWDRGALSQGYGLADAGSTDTFDFGDVRPKSGFYPVEIANSTGNKPVLNGFGTVEVIPGTTNNATHQFFYGRQTGTDIWFRTKRNSQVDYDPWVELYHSGNSVNPKEYGMGSLITTQVTDLNLSPYTDTGRTVVSAPVGNLTNNPVDPNTADRYVCEMQGNTYNGVQRVTNRGSGNTYQRSWDIGSPTEWVQVYTSGNTNFNEFGGVASNDTIGIGGSASSTLAIFYLPINSKVKPSGISVTGTFKIRLPFNGTDLATNITPSINLDASSNKLVALTVSGLSGLPTAGTTLELRTESTSSKITVNF